MDTQLHQYQQLTECEIDRACQAAVEKALQPYFRKPKSDRFGKTQISQNQRGTGVDRNAR